MGDDDGGSCCSAKGPDHRRLLRRFAAARPRIAGSQSTRSRQADHRRIPDGPEGHERLDPRVRGDRHLEFDYSGPLSEMVLIGNLASASRHQLLWDGEAMEVTTTRPANAYVRGSAERASTAYRVRRWRGSGIEYGRTSRFAALHPSGACPGWSDDGPPTPRPPSARARHRPPADHDSPDRVLPSAAIERPSADSSTSVGTPARRRRARSPIRS